MEAISTTTQTTNTFAKGATEEAPTAGNTDFQTFLTLLTAQMRNQDPLKPLDSTDFVAQLATFSSVEQQIQTNDQLAQLVSHFAANDSAVGLAEWIGKEVEHTGQGNYEGEAIEVGVSTAPNAAETILLVRNSNDDIIYRQQFDPSESTIIWNGETTSSGQAENGRYSFEVESYANGKLMDVAPAAQFALVTEVRAEADGIHLIFADGHNMLANNASAVRIPN